MNDNSIKKQIEKSIKRGKTMHLYKKHPEKIWDKIIPENYGGSKMARIYVEGLNIHNIFKKKLALLNL